jgi:hypothetical protein
LADPGLNAPQGRLDQAREEARAAAERTAARLFPYHGIK